MRIQGTVVDFFPGEGDKFLPGFLRQRRGNKITQINPGKGSYPVPSFFSSHFLQIGKFHIGPLRDGF